MRRYQLSLFLFRRDLRSADNNGLNEALRLSDQVIPCFILDPRQIQPHPYQSLPGMAFMGRALTSLQQTIPELRIIKGLPEDIIRYLHHTCSIEAVFVNRDYTPFSRERDEKIERLCQELSIFWHTLPDSLLCEPEQAVRPNGKAYQVFTAFYKNAHKIPVARPTNLIEHRFTTAGLTSLTEPELAGALQLKSPPAYSDESNPPLLDLTELSNYPTVRDFPALLGTTRWSVHLKFGTYSVRTFFYYIVDQLGQEHSLIRQLYWRDFFTHIAYHFPHVFGKPFLAQFNNLVWDNNPEHFQRWRTGNTGFPIIDAGMRELNATGFMHNRARMIVASFLTKDLHISWRWGERYFAQHLVDYDPCVNNGNWQWAASTGCDAQPYFRIFNPWLQQQKFDPDCHYIRRWIPELAGFSSPVIHRWDKQHCAGNYPAPMINHSEESRIAKARYQACMNLLPQSSSKR